MRAQRQITGSRLGLGLIIGGVKRRSCDQRAVPIYCANIPEEFRVNSHCKFFHARNVASQIKFLLHDLD